LIFLKKQHKTYVLLAVVLGIWGLIGFRVVKAINPNEAVVSQPMAVADFKKPKSLEKQPFDIKANYRDPFLGTMPKKKRTLKKRTVKPQPIQWPSVSYLGTMGAKGSKTQLFFLNINGQQHMVRKGEAVSEIKLLSGTKEAVKVRYKGKTKTLAKQ
jgi:hypothetical protein